MPPRTATALLLLGLLLVPTGAGAAKERAPTDAARDAAVERAFAWLDRHLGSLPDTGGTPRKPFVLAMAGLDSLLSHRSSTAADTIPTAEKKLVAYLEEVERRVRVPEELPAAFGSVNSEKLCQYTWALAQAGVFFTELALRGRHRDKSIRTVRRIVAILEFSRAENGGFGHGRVRPGAKASGYPETFLAATSTAESALGMIEAALGPGEVTGLEEMRGYYRKARIENGNFPYDPSQRKAGSDLTGVSRTGGALLAMLSLGIPETDPDVKGSLAFVREHMDYVAEGHGSSMLNLAQTALALRRIGGKPWEEFRAEVFPRILAAQTEDGDLPCICTKKAFATTCDSDGLANAGFLAATGKAYTTSLLLFVLLLDRDLPEIAKKAPKAAPPKPNSVPTEDPRRDGDRDR